MKPRIGNLYKRQSSYKWYYIYDVQINGNRYYKRLHQIIAMYAIGQLYGTETDTHHLNGITIDNRPSNLAVVPNRRLHNKIDLYTKMQKLTGIPVTVRIDGIVYVGDIIRDDNFDVNVAIAWWLRQVANEDYPDESNDTETVARRRKRLGL